MVNPVKVKRKKKKLPKARINSVEDMERVVWRG